VIEQDVQSIPEVELAENQPAPVPNTDGNETDDTEVFMPACLKLNGRPKRSCKTKKDKN